MHARRHPCNKEIFPIQHDLYESDSIQARAFACNAWLYTARDVSYGDVRLSAPVFRLPRLVESDPSSPQVLHMLSAHTRLLWKEGEIEVVVAALSAELETALRNAHNAGQVVRGLESAERRLVLEEQGLRLADKKSSVQRGERISRLLVLSDDGAERFYRNVESLLRRYGPRVLAVRLEVDAATLGERIFGQGRLARLLMLEHKEAVSAVLLAMAGHAVGA
jgi:hypothetical protein